MTKVTEGPGGLAPTTDPLRLLHRQIASAVRGYVDTAGHELQMNFIFDEDTSGKLFLKHSEMHIPRQRDREDRAAKRVTALRDRKNKMSQITQSVFDSLKEPIPEGIQTLHVALGLGYAEWAASSACGSKDFASPQHEDAVLDGIATILGFEEEAISSAIVTFKDDELLCADIKLGGR